VIGVNPLHALMPANPLQISPYSPSSRQFLNVLYIDVTQVADFKDSKNARDFIAQASTQARLAKLRATWNVDYAGVAGLKLTTLRLAYAHFRAVHLASASARAIEFRRYVEERGTPLMHHATFDALDAHFRKQGPQYWGWPSWPAEYAHAEGAAVRRFASEHIEDVEFFLYLQWLAEDQLTQAQALAQRLGMTIGIYGDVAVGVNPGGSETWANRQLYLQDASVGAPPDPLALKGQDWGIPPQDPSELREQGYVPFITMLRNSMRAVGALRLDHVMALCRLWWVPRGFSATDGVYVRYPLDDLMRILALESVRNQCLVVGEDLGTVPDEMRAAMERFRTYHYNVLLFEKERDGRFKAPDRYLVHSLASVATHDLPPLKSWWAGLDIELRSKLGVYPSDAVRDQELEQRKRDRKALIEALVTADLWRWNQHETLPDYSHALMRAIHLYLGYSSARLAVVQIEDLIGMTDPVNVPGTDKEHANWQRKVTANLDEIFRDPEVRETLQAMGKARGGENPNE
jgi:4-alpha-glucanotransferase